MDHTSVHRALAIPVQCSSPELLEPLGGHAENTFV